MKAGWSQAHSPRAVPVGLELPRGRRQEAALASGVSWGSKEEMSRQFSGLCSFQSGNFSLVADCPASLLPYPSYPQPPPSSARDLAVSHQAKQSRVEVRLWGSDCFTFSLVILLDPEFEAHM